MKTEQTTIDLKLSKNIIIMAHPDDEVLWSSSLLYSAEKVIICYSNNNRDDLTGNARINAVSKLPLKNIELFGLTESNIFNSVNWLRPAFNTNQLNTGLFSIKRRQKADFIKNKFLLINKLRSHLSKDSIVITHNPWGEYGHEEHIQLFDIIHQIQNEIGFHLFVSAYVSEKSIFIASKRVNLIKASTIPFPVDIIKNNEIKDIYKSNNVWTWNKNYEWPKEEWFLEIKKLDDINKYPTLNSINLIFTPTNWTIDTKFKNRIKQIKLLIQSKLNYKK